VKNPNGIILRRLDQDNNQVWYRVYAGLSGFYSLSILPNETSLLFLIAGSPTKMYMADTSNGDITALYLFSGYEGVSSFSRTYIQNNTMYITLVDSSSDVAI
jgi:hypothetical protein